MCLKVMDDELFCFFYLAILAFPGEYDQKTRPRLRCSSSGRASSSLRRLPPQPLSVIPGRPPRGCSWGCWNGARSKGSGLRACWGGCELQISSMERCSTLACSFRMCQRPLSSTPRCWACGMRATCALIFHIREHSLGAESIKFT